MSLTQKSLSAVLWSGVDIFLRQGLQFFLSIILARLLTPEDFGLIAIMTLFTGVGGIFIESGFCQALVQRQDITPADESTVFYFNLAAGLIVALGLCAASPWIAAYFDKPILQALTYIMALNLFVGAFGSIHSTLMTKRLDFKTPMKIGVVSSLVSGILAVVLAWRGFAVWSLALQSLASTVITVILLWYWNSWRPSWIFSFASLRSLFGFGSFLLLSGLLDTLLNRLLLAFIGKLFSASELGFYTRAFGTQQLPSGLLTTILHRVTLPVFSAASADKAMLARGVQKALISIMIINIPAMLGLAVVAEPLVITLFGDKWLPSAPILKVLCIYGVLWPLHVINLNVLMAQGHSNLFFRIEIIKTVIAVSTILAASPYGLMAVVWSQVLVSLIGFFVNAYYTGVFIRYPAWRQILDISPYLVVASFMAIVIMQIDAYTSILAPIKLLLMTVSGALFYWLTCRLLKLSAFEMCTELVMSLIGSRFNFAIPYAKILIIIGLAITTLILWPTAYMLLKDFWPKLTEITFSFYQKSEFSNAIVN
ncbi:MAG: lipopolysaccharide biosynthesis protein [Methylomonas sp.]